jgi:hypothetical protein
MAAKLSEQQLAQKYGYALAFFKMHPELTSLLRSAVSLQWTAEEFAARFANTKWYRANTAAFKEWKALLAKNPGEAENQVRLKHADLIAQAEQLGINTTTSRLRSLAQTAVMLKWDEGTLRRALAEEMHYKPKGDLRGDAGAAETNIRELSADYGVTLGEQTSFDLTKKVIAGTLSREGVEEWIRAQAISRFPGLTEQLKAGMTVKELASPYITAQANVLEIDESAIDLRTDQSIQKALQNIDPATNKPVVKPLWAYEKELRQDPRWMKTKNARDSVLGAGQQVLRDWGLIS